MASGVLDRWWRSMIYLILNWMLGTAVLAAFAIVFPGFRVDDVTGALIAAGVMALVHASVSAAFRPRTREASWAISGLFQVPADTLVFRVIALLVPGFSMRGLYPAFAGAVLLLGVNLLLPRLVRERDAAAGEVIDL